jgi:quercetin dioxygenase-like cupin family protein
MSDLLGARLFHLDQLSLDQPMLKLSRRQIVGDRFMVSEVFLEAGCHVPTHAHVNEQLTIVLSGKLRFRIGAELGEETEQEVVASSAGQKELVVGAREAVHFPSELPHAAEALEDTMVLDVFSPVTQGTGVDQGR